MSEEQFAMMEVKAIDIEGPDHVDDVVRRDFHREVERLNVKFDQYDEETERRRTGPDASTLDRLDAIFVDHFVNTESDDETIFTIGTKDTDYLKRFTLYRSDVMEYLEKQHANAMTATDDETTIANNILMKARWILSEAQPVLYPLVTKTMVAMVAKGYTLIEEGVKEVSDIFVTDVYLREMNKFISRRHSHHARDE